MRRVILAIALTCAWAAPAAAQQLTVAFNEGLVTVDATSVPVRQILNEWSKKGGTKVIGVERVTGAPLTIKLVDVPEAKALEVILRSVAGYMAAPRSAGEGLSMYDRILVMATSSTPAPSTPARPAPQPNPAFNGTQRFIPPQRQVSEDDEQREEDPTPPNPPVFTFPGAPGPGGQPTFPGVQNLPPQMQPMIVNPANGNVQQPMQIIPAPGGYPSTAPFGSTTPGVINAPPAQPGQRPPGGRQQQ